MLKFSFGKSSFLFTIYVVPWCETSVSFISLAANHTLGLQWHVKHFLSNSVYVRFRSISQELIESNPEF